MQGVEHLLPERGLLREYIDFSRPLSCVPLQYHLFAGLLVIAAALGNRVFVPLGAQRVCPQLWVALLGPSPLLRAAAMGMARRILGRLAEPPLIGEPATAQRIRRALNRTGGGLLIWPDLGEALRGFRWRSLSGFKGYLTETFDGRTDYHWEGDEEERLVASSPALSILAGGSIEGLSQNMREEEMAGLLPRFLFVPAGPGKGGLVLGPEPDRELEERLAVCLSELSQVCGPADLSQVKTDFVIWCQEHEEDSQGMLYPFLAFLPLYFLKLALIYQLCLGPELKVGGEAMAWAANCVSWLRSGVNEVARDLVFGEARKKAKILRLIETNPGISHAQALRNSHMRTAQFRSYINTLKEEGRIEERNGCYYPMADFCSQAGCERSNP